MIKCTSRQRGFTLIEVMVALVVLSVGLGALMVASTENVRIYKKLQDRMLENWVSIQAVHLLELKMVPLTLIQPYYAVTTINHRKCYWKMEAQPTKIPSLLRIEISSKMLENGPYDYHVTTYHTQSISS